ncbi:MAG TPA: PqqD family protein [Clostridia bacterium]|nr:PqqD family protein [Clostridia bacterium]
MHIGNIPQISGEIETKKHPELIQNTDVLFREEGEDVLLINPSDRSVYHLNQTAAELWNICGTGHSTQEVMEEMRERYELDDEQEADIIETLNDMALSGLLKIRAKENCDDVYLHRIGASDSYVLNESSGFIWCEIDGHKSVEQIINNLCNEYELDFEEAKTQTEEVLQYFLDEVLITVA